MFCLKPARLGGSKSRDLESEAVEAFGMTSDDHHSHHPLSRGLPLLMESPVRWTFWPLPPGEETWAAS